ncbi:MAG TPA: hypothetical protein VGN23_04105 [Verrucomicrobiae bacterium]
MPHHSSPISLIITIVIVIYFLFFNKGFDSEYFRLRALRALAKKLQLNFSSNVDFEAPKRWAFISWMNRGTVPTTYNTFHGYYQDCLVTFFDYSFAAGSARYYWSTYILELKANFPDLLISHETMESRIVEALGQNHLAFESAEFSHKFRVRCADKKFAYEICHQKMMEFLLANQDLTIEIKGGAIALLFEVWLKPEKVEHNLARLIELRKLLPAYLFEKPRH